TYRRSQTSTVSAFPGFPSTPEPRGGPAAVWPHRDPSLGDSGAKASATEPPGQTTGALPGRRVISAVYRSGPHFPRTPAAVEQKTALDCRRSERTVGSDARVRARAVVRDARR